MKALVYTGPHVIAFRDEPDPVPGNDEVLVRIDAVGICGSDMHAYHGFDTRRPAPLILGHEAAGRVLTGPLTGRRVAINPLRTCGTCDDCLDGRVQLCPQRQVMSLPQWPGSFAEMVRVPEANLVEIPADFDIVKSALTEPVAVSDRKSVV